MSTGPKYFKQDLGDMRASSHFEEIFKEVTEEMLPGETWSYEEAEAMRLISEGQKPQDVRAQIKLNNESNKKIADMYFMILLNTLIRSRAPMPFKLPENEISSWPDNYSRGQFAADLANHQADLGRTAVGKKAMKAASEYAGLYESTVGPKPKRAAEKAEETAYKAAQGDSSTFDKACNTLGFLYGVADALLPGPSRLPSMLTVTSQSASMGYAAGMFANGICLLAKLALGVR